MIQPWHTPDAEDDGAPAFYTRKDIQAMLASKPPSSRLTFQEFVIIIRHGSGVSFRPATGDVRFSVNFAFGIRGVCCIAYEPQGAPSVFLLDNANQNAWKGGLC